ncbi:MAG: phosphatidylserine/phosphatidylglycerophosphate/cardiolipin synthase family protein [Verrucomicrobiaceae bacterium]|nr:phosphatidylserine/phosphatidylglycerophosphate/cardiolipin synthase family protein [Verrucomicrobiaceae bacterium]
MQRCLSVAALCLLAQCSTPKGLEMMPTKITRVPVVEQLAHLWRASVGSLARAPVSTTKAVALSAAQRTHAFFAGTTPLPTIETLPPDAPAPGTEAFEALLDAQKLPARSSGKVRLLVDGAEFFPELVREVKNARTSIDSQVFIFDNDDTGVRFADLLREKSRQIPVRVFIDGLGTRTAHKVNPETPPPPGFQPPDFIGDYLVQDSDVKLRVTTNPALLCDHTKLHLIDGRLAYMGGMNIGREYESEWHDLMARVEGPVVLDLANIFQRHWDGESWVRNWTLQNALHRREAAGVSPQQVAGAYPLRVLRTYVAKGRKEIARALRTAVQAARQRVWVHTPYLAEEGMISDFLDAARRGVDVRIILPGANDSGIMNTVNHTSAARLIAAGVKVYGYPGMTHMKVVLCDGWAMFGSANCDTLSLKLNRELNLASSAPPFVQSIQRRVFEADFSLCQRLTQAAAEKKGSTLMGVIGNQL